MAMRGRGEGSCASEPDDEMTAVKARAARKPMRTCRFTRSPGPAPGAAAPPPRRATRGTASASLDHLVGPGEQGGRKVDAKAFRGSLVDDQLELGCLLHRKIAGVARSRIRS